MEHTVKLIQPFKKFFDGVKNLFRSQKKTELVEYSRFRHYLENIDRGSEDYEIMKTAVDVCDEAYMIMERKDVLTERLKFVNEGISELEVYSKLEDDDANRIKDLLDRLRSLTNERKSLIGQLNAFEKPLSFMKALEDEVPDAIDRIKEAEDKQMLFKKDLGYLESERTDLVYEIRRFETALTFIQRFSVGMCIFFGIAAITLAILHILDNFDALLPIYSLVILVIVIYALLYAFRKRIIFEKELNLKKQNKAIDLINKKTVLYAHYTNFLNYEYKKFKVKSSSMLKDNLAEYGLYKHLTGRLDSVRNILYQTESEIEELLKQNKMFNQSFSIDMYLQLFDLDYKKSNLNEFLNEKSELEANLDHINNRLDELLDVLTSLSEKDTTKDGLMKQLVLETKSCYS